MTKSFVRGIGAIVVSASLALSGCVTIESSSISSRSSTGTAVTASADGWGILRLTVPPGLTGSVNTQLAGGCTSGKFSNAQTELQMREFLVAQHYVLISSAACE
jgi:hypothetical protein